MFGARIHIEQRFCTTSAMGKKRKAGKPFGEERGEGFEPKLSGLKITTYEDVADSEDEFHINRDKILLDERPEAKRRRKWQEEGMTGTCLVS